MPSSRRSPLCRRGGTDPEEQIARVLVHTQQGIVKAAPRNDVSDPTLVELQEQLRKWAQPAAFEEPPMKILNHTSLSLGAASTLGLIVLILFFCISKRRNTGKHNLPPSPPHMPVPSAPVHPDFDHIPNLQARLVRLETIITELQLKLERVAQHEMALESLKRKCEQITALL